ncbi:MAG: hypothetical protein V1754_02690 [Pseudomonadota bacterium]
MKKILMFCFAVTFAACGSSGTPSSDATSGKDAKVADTFKGNVLSAQHTGWKEATCGQSGCHTLPVANHTQTSPVECVSCHGANGACSVATHKSSGCSSSSCHGTKHDIFTSDSDCVACHLATTADKCF